MVEIKKDSLIVKIDEKGAQLSSINDGIYEYIWQKDPNVWQNSSPILFPFIGVLKDGKYKYKGKEYEMNRHGFIRDEILEVVDHKENSVTFKFSSNERTMLIYPFEFDFEIKYTIEENKKLSIKFLVKNKNEDKMLFSLGGHPGFNLKIDENNKLGDYYFEFSEREEADQLLLDGPFLLGENVKYLNNESVIRLNEDIFNNDAIIMENIKSDKIFLKNDKGNNYLEIGIKDFPYIAIWSFPKAPFVCVEPWCGLPDEKNHDGNLENKKGINILEANEEFSREITIKIINK